MPNKWVTAGPGQFRQQHPDSSEQPWFDLACLRFLSDQRFPWACQLIGLFRDELNSYVVAELASEGDLFSTVTGVPGRANELKWQPLVRQLCQAVQTLHDFGIAHRDISMENVLLTRIGDDLQVKLIDFGCGTIQRHCTEVRGKPPYQAPEMHAGVYDAFLSDAFAIGVLIYCIAALDLPWASTEPGRCRFYDRINAKGFRSVLEDRRAMQNSGSPLKAVFSEALVCLLEGLLASDPNCRLTLGESCYLDAKGSTGGSVWGSAWFRVSPVASAQEFRSAYGAAAA